MEKCSLVHIFDRWCIIQHLCFPYTEYELFDYQFFVVRCFWLSILMNANYKLHIILDKKGVKTCGQKYGLTWVGLALKICSFGPAQRLGPSNPVLNVLPVTQRIEETQSTEPGRHWHNHRLRSFWIHRLLHPLCRLSHASTIKSRLHHLLRTQYNSWDSGLRCQHFQIFIAQQWTKHAAKGLSPTYCNF